MTQDRARRQLNRRASKHPLPLIFCESQTIPANHLLILSLMTMTSYSNNSSGHLNELCLHSTYQRSVVPHRSQLTSPQQKLQNGSDAITNIADTAHPAHPIGPISPDSCTSEEKPHTSGSETVPNICQDTNLIIIEIITELSIINEQSMSKNLGLHKKPLTKILKKLKKITKTL